MFACPGCGARYRDLERWRGRRIRCARCGVPFIVAAAPRPERAARGAASAEFLRRVRAAAGHVTGWLRRPGNARRLFVGIAIGDGGAKFVTTMIAFVAVVVAAGILSIVLLFAWNRAALSTGHLVAMLGFAYLAIPFLAQRAAQLVDLRHGLVLPAFAESVRAAAMVWFHYCCANLGGIAIDAMIEPGPDVEPSSPFGLARAIGSSASAADALGAIGLLFSGPLGLVIAHAAAEFLENLSCIRNAVERLSGNADEFAVELAAVEPPTAPFTDPGNSAPSASPESPAP
jgi:DNA-directed RNA polymerase subunit RPC12/RpoP